MHWAKESYIVRAWPHQFWISDDMSHNDVCMGA